MSQSRHKKHRGNPSLASYADSRYIEALNAMTGKRARRKVVAYVEGYDDISFWSSLLRPLETDDFYFEVMLPSSTTPGKGKKVALSNQLGERLGQYMIACVDADYDYLMQSARDTSAQICQNPYVFHTYVYAIENYHCYAPSLYEVCVTATLNDHRFFDFEAFLKDYSQTIWPLFVWNVWCYRYGVGNSFSLLDFARIASLPDINPFRPEEVLTKLHHRVNAKIARLQKAHPEGKKTYKPLREQLLHLGLTPETTYLFMRGHDVQDGVVLPILQMVCERLRREREREIRTSAVHSKQLQNELAGYQHSTAPCEQVLKRHRGYTNCLWYKRIQQDISSSLSSFSKNEQA